MTSSEFRKDPLSDRWVIIAQDRGSRPTDFERRSAKPRVQRCPFCVGHEHDTPPAIATWSEPADETWQVRVVPNKYPAVQFPDASGAYAESAASVPPRNGRAGGNGANGVIGSNGMSLFQRQPALGEHEIIVESPHHVESLTELTDEQLQIVLRAFRERMRSHYEQKRWKYVQLFKNVGAFAGATLRHTHSQLVAMPMIPKRISEELTFAEKHFKAHSRCIFCDLLRQEQQAGQRMVASESHFAAFCPFASRFAYETWIIPRRHQCHFWRIDDEQIAELGAMLRKTLQAVERCCGDSGYNLLFHTSPFQPPAEEHYHWHLEVIPRVTTQAGFEWGSEYWINPLAPEQAADDLKR